MTIEGKEFNLVPVYKHVNGAVHIGYDNRPSDENPSWVFMGYILEPRDA